MLHNLTDTVTFPSLLGPFNGKTPTNLWTVTISKTRVMTQEHLLCPSRWRSRISRYPSTNHLLPSTKEVLFPHTILLTCLALQAWDNYKKKSNTLLFMKVYMIWYMLLTIFFGSVCSIQSNESEKRTTRNTLKGKYIHQDYLSFIKRIHYFIAAYLANQWSTKIALNLSPNVQDQDCD